MSFRIFFLKSSNENFFEEKKTFTLRSTSSFQKLDSNLQKAMKSSSFLEKKKKTMEQFLGKKCDKYKENFNILDKIKYF